jgi:hypothetical protein
MFHNSKVTTVLRQLKILLLGSYHPLNFPILQRLQIYLIEHGITQVQFGFDIPNSDERVNSDNINNKERIYLKIYDVLHNDTFDFYLFVFFGNRTTAHGDQLENIKENESTIIELKDLMGGKILNTHFNRVLAFFPTDYDSTLLEGNVGRWRLNTYYYNSEEEIHLRAYSFILHNASLGLK